MGGLRDYKDRRDKEATVEHHSAEIVEEEGSMKSQGRPSQPFKLSS